MQVTRQYADKFLALMFAFGMSLLFALPANAIMATETLTIMTGTGQHHFEVEIARTDEEQARGLMGRRYMPVDRGMIFDYPVVPPIS